MPTNRKFMTGYEMAVQAAVDAGAEVMYGYPITPTCEVLAGWAATGKPYLQTEDEIAAGFALCGAVLGGKKAFTASSGPGHVLLQDGFSMAEGMCLPAVMIIGQRGGPSSGTVIYSQQEVTLACYGGNGEGLRFVYSPSNVVELYQLTRQAFNDAWHYRFPAVVLTDGYTLKTRSTVDFEKFRQIENIPSSELIPEDKIIHWPNIYTFEEELYDEVLLAQKDFEAVAVDIARAEEVQTNDAEILIIAHGIVAASVRDAVIILRSQGKKVGLFRPVTLRPFPKKQLDKATSGRQVQKIVMIESSLGQLARMVRDELAPEISVPFEYFEYPGVGVEAEDVVKKINV